jgi:hypothetical protein
MAFGTVSYLLFKKKIANKMRQLIPHKLSSFAIEGFDEIGKSAFKAILSCVMSYVEAAFIAYEEEIDRQKKVIVQLRLKNERLQTGEWHHAVGVSQDKISTDDSDYGLRSLRRHAAYVANVVRTQSGGCDMKAIVLARESYDDLNEAQIKNWIPDLKLG